MNPQVARRVFLSLLALVAAGAGALIILMPNAGPPPQDIANDPLLVLGRETYFARCVSCHGERGKGDGPIAKGLSGSPPVGDLTDGRWKHGESPEAIHAVIAKGVPNTNMAAWGRSLSEDSVRAVTAYVLHLAGREIPSSLRDP